MSAVMKHETYKRENLAALKATNDFDREELVEILREFEDNAPNLDPISDHHDFTTDNDCWRFIRADAIDGIQREELSNDEYLLGCFNADFLSRVTDWPVELIQAAQEGEAHEALGRALLVDDVHLVLIQENYANDDGYGHHFAHYDHETHEISLNGQDWFYFKCN